jgi:hypothetical protein
MKLQEVLSQINAPKGLTSILAGISQNDFSVLPHQKGLDATMAVADERIAEYRKSLDECKSDWSYWSILSDLEYWCSVKNILEAAQIVGENNLPDVHYQPSNSVVMDEIANVRKFGEAVLSLAKQQAAGNKNK